MTHLKSPSRASPAPSPASCLPKITGLCEWARPVPTAKEALRTPAIPARMVKAGELHRHLMNTQAQGDGEGKGCRENQIRTPHLAAAGLQSLAPPPQPSA